MYLRDGRNALVQWDLDRQLVIEDPSVTRVHYCNRLTTEALVCEVKQDGDLRVADIPNVLLQTPWDIKAFCMCDCYAREMLTLTIKAKTKPADYVYSETEILGVEEIAYRAANEALNDSKDEFINELAETVLADLNEVIEGIIEHQNQLLGVSE